MRIESNPATRPDAAGAVVTGAAGQTDPDSRARTHLANERTFLAWLRTGITLIALGLAAAQFLSLESAQGGLLMRGLAGILVLSGVVVIVQGRARFLRGSEQIEVQAFRPATRSVDTAVALGLLVALLALGFVLFLRP